MNLILVSIEDVFVGFNNPKMAKNRDAAMRDFKLICKEDVRADDLRLWEIGEFNTDTGEILPKKPDLIMKGVSNDKDTLG